MSKRKDFRKLITSILIGIVAAVAIFFFFGIPTDVIKNPKYIRMVPATALDIFFLYAISILFGIYIALVSYILFTKKSRKISSGAATGGTIASFFAIACPTCIQFLVWIFGAAFLMKYYDPIRPFIGFLSMGLISFGIYKSIQVIRNKCDSCVSKG